MGVNYDTQDLIEYTKNVSSKDNLLKELYTTTKNKEKRRGWDTVHSILKNNYLTNVQTYRYIKSKYFRNVRTIGSENIQSSVIRRYTKSVRDTYTNTIILRSKYVYKLSQSKTPNRYKNRIGRGGWSEQRLL